METFELSSDEIERVNRLQCLMNFAPTHSREYQLARTELNEILYGVSALSDRLA